MKLVIGEATDHLWWCQPWFRQWLGVIRQQAITCASVNPVLCGHKAASQQGLFIFFFLRYLLRASELQNFAVIVLIDCTWLCYILFGFGQFCLIWFILFFYPRPVLAFGYCRCLRLSVCVSVRVRQPSACPRDNSSSVQARITKFGP